MREHQIVITLKPDQFLEVQRLARAANAKSMGIFVRQKLLAALGIEGSLGGSGSADGVQAEEVLEALGQIKRLHSELKTFVAESLSLYGDDLLAVAEQPAVSAEFPDAPMTVPAEPVADQLEKVAETTFAISPRLGSIGDPMPGTAASTTNAAAHDRPGERHETHRRDQHRLHHPHAGSDVMDVPFKPAETPAAPAPVVNDPLDKLLPTDDEFRPAEADADFEDDTDYVMPPDEYQIPPSIAERRRQLASNAFSFADETPVQSAPAESAFAAEADLDSFAEDDTPAPAPAVQPPASSIPGTAAPSDKPAQPAPADPDVNSSSGRPLGYPSFSGSPPPKRRQV